MKLLQFLVLLLMPMLLISFFQSATAQNNIDQKTEETKSLNKFEVFLKKGNFDFKTKRLFKDELTSFYKDRAFKPVWFDNQNNSIKNIDNIKDDIKKHAYENGLRVEDYNFDISDTLNSFNRELAFSNSFLHYINDVQSGRIDPKKFDTLVMTLPEKLALADTYKKGLSQKNLYKFLDTLAPQQSEYKQLKEKLAAYREIEKGEDFIKINSDAVIYPGESHQIIPQIRTRLEQSYKEYDGRLPDGIWVDESQIKGEKLSDVIANRDQVKDEKDKEISKTNPNMVYDPTLAKRVAEFQYFHGLKTDGVIGPATIGALNIPISKRINQIVLAMERWRWLPSDLGKKHIRVNIAGYYARAVKNGKDAFVMPIVVGKVAHQTPVFSSVISNVKLHPDWTSPDSISKRYVIPKIKNNPSVINTLGYEVIDKNTWQVIPWSQVNISSLNSASTKNYMFRQKPGNKNALGLARFSIVNDQAIFMHGTPSMSLFNKDDRNFSSGCIRLEDPFEMAYFLLKDQGISKKKLSNLYYLDDGETADTNILDLKNDVPVHLMYMTAWIDQEGNIHFNEDVYGRDAELNRALKKLG